LTLFCFNFFCLACCCNMRFLIFELSRLFIKNSRPKRIRESSKWSGRSIGSTTFSPPWGCGRKTRRSCFWYVCARRFSLVDVLFGASFSFLFFFLHRL
jgi:hypothetical protein